MKGDDPRLEEAHKTALESAKKIADIKLTVINYHLVVEQFMNDFLKASGKKHKGLEFWEKAELCMALNPPEIDPQIWKVLEAANQLRNKIAHTLDQKKIQAKIDVLRVAYITSLTPTQAEAAEKLDDVQVVGAALQHCGAYLVAATNAVRARQAASPSTSLPGTPPDDTRQRVLD
jgi:hypothetical protein